MNETDPEPRHWLERPGSVNKVIYALAVICIVVVVADFFYEKTTHHSWETTPGFYALFGFFSCVFLVIVAKGLRRILKRDEDYYD